MMFKNLNPEFLSESLYATEFVQAMFQAYGHQNYHSKEDFRFRSRSGASRTDAFVQAYKEYSPEDFLELILKNSDNIETIFKELIKLNFISHKSASFFLRDIEGLEYDILPIDVNVAYSFQYTGLFFMTEGNALSNSNNIDFFNVVGKNNSCFKRTEISQYQKCQIKIYWVCEKLGHNPRKLTDISFTRGRILSILKCTSCCVNEYCYFNNLSNSQKEKFIEQIKLD